MDSQGMLMMGVYTLGVGIGFGLTFIASTMMLLQYFGRRANLELYSIMCLLSTTAALGPAFGGWMRDKLGDFILTFEVCTVATAAILIATLFVKKPAQKPNLPAAAPAAAGS
jgi:cyanate permease